MKSENDYTKRLNKLIEDYKKLVGRPNKKMSAGNGVFDRYENPVLTAAHTPVFWRYDLDEKSNPLLLERMGISCLR